MVFHYKLEVKDLENLEKFLYVIYEWSRTSQSKKRSRNPKFKYFKYFNVSFTKDEKKLENEQKKIIKITINLVDAFELEK